MTIYIDAATIRSVTSVSSTDIKSNVDSATIKSSTSVNSVDAGPYYDSNRIQSVTTPDVLVEIPTTINLYVSLSGSTYEGATLTASISTSVTSGGTSGGGGTVITDPDASGYTVVFSPAGQWYTADDDNGLIT